MPTLKKRSMKFIQPLDQKLKEDMVRICEAEAEWEGSQLYTLQYSNLSATLCQAILLGE